MIIQDVSPVIENVYTVPISYTEEKNLVSSQGLSSRASLRYMKGMLRETPRLCPMGSYVGELQEKWQFPSDHLPIAMSFDRLNIASWNVLDAAYMDWVIEKNHQGLSRSLISDEHVYIGDSKLTFRDLHTIDLVKEMIESPRDVIALQECSRAFIKQLRSELPENFKIIAHYGEALVINMNQFEVMEAKAVRGIFKASPQRTLQVISLLRKETQETLHFVNAHLPGDPNLPGRFEFAEYLAEFQKANPDDVVIGLGDMNFNELEMKEAFSSAYGKGSPWQMISPYCTNIAPDNFYSKAIDHFFIYDAKGRQGEGCIQPEKIMTELAPVHALLNESK